MNKLGIIITTFLRDELLEKSIQSLESILQPNWELIIVDQNKKINSLYKYHRNYLPIPYNTGLSFARNEGVEYAKDLGCDYVVISSDSFLMNESLQKLQHLVKNDLFNYAIIGFYLSGCACGWEAKLNLIPNEGFELNFIDKTKIPDYVDLKEGIGIFNCDIVKNFFIAKTDSLLNIKWDDNLKLGEHEDFFWRYKQAGYKVGWTDIITAEKMKDRPDEYSEFRRKNFNEGIQKLKEKYKIKNWVIYKNLENAKKG